MGLVEHAKREFEAMGWPGDSETQEWMCNDLLAVLEVFATGYSKTTGVARFSEKAKAVRRTGRAGAFFVSPTGVHIPAQTAG